MDEKRNTPRNPRRRTPFQVNRRLQAQYLSWLLILTMLLGIGTGILVKDREFSDSENRMLAQFPKITFSSLFDGSFLEGLGDYTADQFPGRDAWISLNLKMNQLLGQKEAGGVYLCGDGYLIQIPEEPNWVQAERNLAAAESFAAKYPDLNMVMTVAPNAVTVLSNLLPANAPARDQREDIAWIQARLDAVQFCDVTDALLAHKDEGVYYKTDHHWTSLGAKYAFHAMTEALNITTVKEEDYTAYPVSNTFEGTLSSKSGSHASRDTVEIFIPHTSIDYYVNYADTGENVSSLYRRSALNQKDHYTVFFGGNHSRVDITTTADTGRCLLLFKDSYANCMVQFLYPYYDHITMIDPRYYYDNIDLVIKSESITDVLFLYNADTFLSDTSLADVLLSEG